jgi:Zn finger protein HypA/HybF involved in hydrogenase expression
LNLHKNGLPPFVRIDNEGAQMKWTIKCNRCGLSWNKETDGVTFPIADCPRCHDDTLRGLSVYAETPVTDECNQCGRTWTSVIVKNCCPYCGSTDLVGRSKDAVQRYDEINGLQTIKKEKVTAEEQGEVKPTQPVSLPKQNDAGKKVEKSSSHARKIFLTVFIPVFGLLCGVIGTFLAFFQVYPEFRPLPTPLPTPAPCIVVNEDGSDVYNRLPVRDSKTVGHIPKGSKVKIDDIARSGGVDFYKISGYTFTQSYDIEGYIFASTVLCGDFPITLPEVEEPLIPMLLTGHIAFVSDRDGNYEIYVMNADGSQPKNLTQNPADDFSPAWSPDGRYIAFFSERDGNYEIYVMNADGSQPKNLTQNLAADYSPAWSPDGQHIAFQTERDGNYEIYVMNADGSQPKNLTQNPAAEWSPAWSPDGQHIAFSSNRDGNYEIYIMNADGSQPKNLTQNSIDNSDPDWSPDGQHIIFSSESDGNLEINVMKADGSQQTNLIQNRTDYSPAWSPDGQYIVFYSERDGNNEIYVMNADGSQQTNLTQNLATDWSPDWSLE